MVPLRNRQRLPSRRRRRITRHSVKSGARSGSAGAFLLELAGKKAAGRSQPRIVCDSASREVSGGRKFGVIGPPTIGICDAADYLEFPFFEAPISTTTCFCNGWSLCGL